MAIIGDQTGDMCLPDDAGVPSMKSKAAVEDIQEKLDLLGVSKVPCHRLKHPSHQIRD